MMARIVMAMLVAGSVLVGFPTAARAQRPDEQGQAPNAANRMTTKVSGALAAMQGRLLQVTGEDEQDYLIQAPEDIEKIRYTGTAVPAWLQPGMFIRFEAPFDDRGRGAAPVSQLEVFTPHKGRRTEPEELAEITPGIYPLGGNAGPDLFGGEQQQPPRGRRPGPQTTDYKIVGRVGGINRRGVMTVAAGQRPVQIELDPEAKISVNLLGWDAASQGDHVEVEGFYIPPNETQVLAESIRITAADTLGEAEAEDEPRARRGRRTRGTARGRRAPRNEAAEREEPVDAPAEPGDDEPR